MAKELGHMSATIDLDINPFLTNQKQLEAQLKRDERLLRMQEQLFRKQGISVSNLGTVYNRLSNQLKGYETRLETQKNRYKELKTAAEELKKSGKNLTADQQKELAQAATKYETTKTKVDSLKLSIQATAKQAGILGSRLNQVGTKLTAWGNSMSSVGKSLSNFGTKGALTVTTPLVLGMKKSLQSAIEFNSEIQKIGPLLSNGAPITKQIRSDLASMSASSKEWAQSMGFSTTSINQAIAEMTRRGFSATETLKAMPNVLNATRASGEDLGAVMDVTASTMQQFGYKAKDSRRVVDSLTYAANATSSSFTSMGDAFTYAGPMAAQAGVSIETVAASIGILENNGIKASSAGTALRSALQRLLVKGAYDKKFQMLGVDLEAFRKGAIGLPEVIDQINKATKGMPAPQKAGLIAEAFGKQAQGFMALIQGGGDQLRNLTKEAEKSAGATKRVADQMNRTPAAQWDRFKETLKVVSMQLGEQLLPSFLNVLKGTKKLLDGFSNLSDGTKKLIVNSGLLIASLPLLALAIGKPLEAVGKLSKGFGKLLTATAKLGAGKRGKELLVDTAETAKETKAVTTLGDSFKKVAGKAGSLISKLGKFGPVLGIVGGALIAGVTIWELWGKAAYRASQRAAKWGAPVNEETDKVLNKMQELGTDAISNMDGYGGSVEENGKRVVEDFDLMGKAVERFAKKANKKIDTQLGSLDPNVRALLEADAKKTQEENNKAANTAKKSSNAVTKIYEQAKAQHRSLTQTERDMVVAAQNQMYRATVDMAGKTKKQRTAILSAMTGDVTKITAKQASQVSQSLTQQWNKMQDSATKQRKTLKEMYSNGDISKQAFDNATLELNESQDKQQMKMAASVYALQQKMGNFSKYTKDSSKTYSDGKLALMSLGVTTKQVESYMASLTKTSKGTSDSLAALANNTQADKWNWNFLYDAETGMLRTKDQLKDFLKETVKTEKGWNSVKLMVKKGKIGVEGVEQVGKALVEAGKWNDLSEKEKKLIINAEYKGRLTYKGLTDLLDDGKITEKEIELIASGDTTPLTNFLSSAKEWNSLTIGEKKAVVKDNATVPVFNALTKLKEWNGLTVEQKTAMANVQNLPELGALIIKYGAWQGLDDTTKNIFLADGDFVDKVNNDKSLLEDWNKQEYGIKVKPEADQNQFGTVVQNTITAINSKPKDSVKIPFGAKTKDFYEAFGKVADDTKTPLKQVVQFHPKGKKGVEEDIKDVNDKDTEPKVFPFKHTGVKDVKSKIDQINNKKTKNKTWTFTYKTIYKTKGKPGHNAHGTSSWNGGLTWVGDGGRKEVVYNPQTGGLLKTPRTDTLMNLPQGSRIWKSVTAFEKDARKLGMNIPKFASGTAGNAVALGNQIKGIINGQNQSAVPTNSIENTVARLTSLVENNTRQLAEVVQGLMAIADRPIEVQNHVDFDTKKRAKEMSPYIQKEINNSSVRQNRLIGGIL